MSKIIIAICALFLIASVAQADETAFRSWMKEHGKEYATEHEFAMRYENYMFNEGRFSELKSIYNADFDHNQFSDMTEEEFRASRLMLPFDSAKQCKWPYSRQFHPEDFVAATASDVTDFDWRSQPVNPVTEVKDQGNCGSCWSFSTTGNIEGQNILKNNISTTLSEQELVDCSTSCIASSPTLCDAGCGGGLPWLAYEDIISWGGITSEDVIPYTGMDGMCSNTGSKTYANITSWKSFPAEDISTIEQALVALGPLSITLNANPLSRYRKGIISMDAWRCQANSADHAVLLVGFGNDPTTGMHYWTVKNSWGSSWGEDGFFRIESDEKDLCGIQDCVTTVVM